MKRPLRPPLVLRWLAYPLSSPQIAAISLSVLFVLVFELPSLSLFTNESYLPVHTILEFVAITISIMIFSLGWNIREEHKSDQLPLVGSFFLVVAILDLAHTLSYAGMPAFITQNTPDKSIHFWLVARFFASAALLVLALLPTHKILPRNFTYIGPLMGLVIIVIVSYIILYYSAWLPRTFIPGSGLTSFKINVEYFFVAMCAVSTWLFARRTQSENNVTFAWLAVATWTLGLAELCFTLYETLIDQVNLFGHIFKVVGYIILYHTLFAANVRQPYLRLSEANAKNKLALQELRIAASAFEVQEAMIITDANGIVLRTNQAFSKLTGYSSEDVVGKTSDVFKSMNHDAEFLQSIQNTLLQEKLWVGEVYDKRKDGDIYLKRLSISVVTNDTNIITNYVMVFTDITQFKEAEEDIHRLAYYDPLTNLPNRRLLLERLKQMITKGALNNHCGAILFIDLDNFKTLNDVKGHDFGDLMLKEVAFRLQDCLRVNDTVARLGGDEFVVMLEGLSMDAAIAASQAEVVGDKILATISQPYSLEGHEYHSSASIGISLFHGNEVTIDELLKHADTAMYQSKQAGRNMLRFFNPSMQATLEFRAALETDLRQALVQQQFKLYYQLQVDNNRGILGAEVLLRWQHPERGLVAPMQFIPLAEETGLILPIGRYVLETACSQLKEWERDEHKSKLTLAVNVSARQFRQVDFVDQVREVLEQTGANPKLLKLELTESLVLDNMTNTIEKMQTLKLLGLSFSMDDFGTGYSSLASLKLLPLDQLKIDQSFVRDITTDPDDAVIVKTIIGMANSLELNVIAEGVETEAQLKMLKHYHCHAFQGYLFGKPVPLEEFEQLLKNHK